MRGLKTLSPLLIIGLSLVLMGSASAQGSDMTQDSTFDLTNIEASAIGDSYAVFADGGTITVRDLVADNVVIENSYDGSVSDVEVNKTKGIYAYAWTDSSGSPKTTVRSLTDGSELYEETNSKSSAVAMDMGQNHIYTGYWEPNANQISVIDLESYSQDGTVNAGGDALKDVEAFEDHYYATSANAGQIDLFKYEAGTTNQVNVVNPPSKSKELGIWSEGIAFMSENDGLITYDSNLNQLSSISVNSALLSTEMVGDQIAIPQSDSIQFYDFNTLTSEGSLSHTVNSPAQFGSNGEQFIISDSETAEVYGEFFSLPESTTVTEESTNLATGSFAVSSSAGIVAAAKGISAAAAGLATWELGIEDWLFGTNDADKDLWKGDIRANAVTLEDQRQNILNASELSEDALFGDAMATARSQGVQAFNNGSTREEAKTQVENTVEDYYSDVERTVVNGYNNEILNLQNDKDNAEAAGADFSAVFQRDFEDLAVVNSTYTLPNGEEIPTYYVVDNSGATIMTLENGDGTGLQTTSSSEYDSAQYLDGSAHYEVIQGVRDTRSNAITNVNSIIDNIYDNNEQGTLNVSDQLSALELTEALSTDYSETGSYNYAAASLARTGQPTDLDSAFNISYQGESYEGALFASEAVVGSEVESDTTYNGADGNAVFVAQGEESAQLVELREEFTVNSITSLESGEQLSNTSLQEESAYTQDVSDLQSEINSLEKAFKESQSSNGGIGPTGGFFAGTTGALAAVILILGFVLVGANLA